MPVRARLDALGFRPSSARGQNFLLDPTLHAWIAEVADAGPADVAVEIGVGLGFLTRALAERAGAVVGVEVDRRLYEVSIKDLADMPNVRLVHADALSGPGRSLAPEVQSAIVESRDRLAADCASTGREGRVLVVANLPYSISGALMVALFTADVLPDRVVVLVQRELAERFAGTVGEEAYGGLSVTLQSLFDVRVLRTVRPDVFRPRPKVASAVVQLDLRPAPSLLQASDRQRFAAFVRTLFGKRRKVMRTTLVEAVQELSPAWSELAADERRVKLGERLGVGSAERLLARRSEEMSAREVLQMFHTLADA